MGNALQTHQLTEPSGETMTGYIRRNLVWFKENKAFYSANKFVEILRTKGFETNTNTFLQAYYRSTQRSEKAPKTVELAKATPQTKVEETPYASKFARPQSEKRTFTVTNIPRTDILD